MKPHSVEDQLLPESFHCSTGGMDQKQDTCCSSLKLAAHNLSQKPRLLLKNCSDVKHAGSELTNLKLDSKELINFKMPSGVQFANLCRIQASYMYSTQHFGYYISSLFLFILCHNL